MTTKDKTTSDRIRALLAQGYSYRGVCDELGCSRAHVYSADKHRGPMGRPRLPRCRHCGSKCTHDQQERRAS